MSRNVFLNADMQRNLFPMSTDLLLIQVLERSPVNTVVGEFIVQDPDNFGPRGYWQNATCTLTLNADGLFIADDNILKVSDTCHASSHFVCLHGWYCLVLLSKYHNCNFFVVFCRVKSKTRSRHNKDFTSFFSLVWHRWPKLVLTMN